MDGGRYCSTGEAAKLLGVTRDALIHALRYGAPEPEAPRMAGRRVFGGADIERLRAWFRARGRSLAS